ncbi:substrate-binding domain-containing protein [Laspinema olomoucense]|uniref:substrate-binding domain-containing protein n=1 Tax=Laspinema olomoucense TaxID=3231600 RepID=UPI0021BAA52D|nr:substrate-binding domain-containing protein [Laspinema sp. D3d]MCT7975574.1 substrate-binding domain-containing protein [Laspinema sp. D3d]
MSKDIGKKLAQEAGSRELSRIIMRGSSIKLGMKNRLFRFVPARFQWVIPFIQQNLKIEPPKLSALKFQLPGRLRQNQDLAKNSQQLAPEIEIGTLPEVFQPVQPLYLKYDCARGNPLSCEEAQQTLEANPQAKYCRQCGFPVPLAPETKIRGDRGTYQIERLLRHRGMGRLYAAIQLSDRQPVILKEYILPHRYFNSEEIRQRKDLFRLVGGINLADGRIQDQRLISPWEAVAPLREERCYLVTKGQIDAFPNLSSYLLETGAFTNAQVRQVLDQVLQSLEFLHEQKFRLRSGALKQGIIHGNLSLDSLIFVPNTQGFFIYLCDLALWENFGKPILSDSAYSSPGQDLKALGYVAFYLLAGRTFNPQTEQEIDPRVEDDWPLGVHPALKDFILNLIGLGTQKFETAQVARQTLLKLSGEWWIGDGSVIPLGVPETIILETVEKKRRLRRRLLAFLLGTAGLILLALLIWWAMVSRQQKAVAKDPVCCIDKLAGIPLGNFTYTASVNGTWSFLLQQPNLIAPGRTLEQDLQQRLQPEDPAEPPKYTFRYLPEPSSNEAIAKVLSGETDFAITNLLNARTAYDNLIHTQIGYREFAYDGIVVFVPFSYSRRENGLPQRLNGSITFDQLRQLYTGKIRNWQELGGPNLPVKLYIPNEEEALRIFEQRVLKDERAIAEFHNLLKTPTTANTLVRIPAPITPLSTFSMLRTVIRDFEDRNIGSIGFGTLSKVFGQCSVYPLALSEGNQPPVSPLVRNLDNQPISPLTDLCNNKGSYSPNVTAFSQNHYPLAYPLVVIYPRDNRLPSVGEKFAEILTTLEVQNLLDRTGLIPIYRQSPP